MKGIEISKSYWEQFGKPGLEEKYPGLINLIAVGLVGSGSECYGFDDELSRDHDFEPGFCIFIPGEDKVDRRQEFLLERFYASLPREFMGVERAPLNPAGGNRRGVIRIAEFYEKMTGIPSAPQSWKDYLSLPDYALAEVTNGEVFLDNQGEFSAIRSAWQNPPDDVKLKKLCGFLLTMSQTGEYNFPRCSARGDKGAAKLCAAEYVKAAMGAAFWSGGKGVPYYKWSFRALKEMGDCERIYHLLEEILCSAFSDELITECSVQVLELLKEKDIIPSDITDLQQSAMLLNSEIKDASLRNLSLLAAV